MRFLFGKINDVWYNIYKRTVVMLIKFAEKQDLKKVAELSKNFANEGCCNGIIADDEEYFIDKEVAIAVDGDNIVGYAYGEIEIAKKDKSYIKKDDKIFYLEEMYVDSSKRNMNIGKMLFEFLENEAKKNGASVIELNAVSKDYKKLLKFYLDDLNMNFLSAYLYKKL